MNTKLFVFILLIHSTTFAAWQVAPSGDSPDQLMKFIPRNQDIPDRANIGKPCNGGVIKKIDDKTFWVYMHRNYPLATVCERVVKTNNDKSPESHTSWRVAPSGDSTSRPLKFIPRNPNIPERAPIGEPCIGGVIKKIDDKTSWVYMRRNYGLAAVCEWTDKLTKHPTRIGYGRAKSPPRETVTFSHAYDVSKIPPDVTNIISYIRGTIDGTNWSSWERRVTGITGCTKYKVRKSLKYQYKETYANRYGKEGPPSETVTITAMPSKDKPQC